MGMRNQNGIRRRSKRYESQGKKISVYIWNEFRNIQLIFNMYRNYRRALEKVYRQVKI